MQQVRNDDEDDDDDDAGDGQLKGNKVAQHPWCVYQVSSLYIWFVKKSFLLVQFPERAPVCVCVCFLMRIM